MICKSLFLDSTSLACSTREGLTATVVDAFIAALAFTADSVRPHVTTAFADATITKTVVVAEWVAVRIATQIQSNRERCLCLSWAE